MGLPDWLCGGTTRPAYSQSLKIPRWRRVTVDRQVKDLLRIGFYF